jgi:hypothetical protein
MAMEFGDGNAYPIESVIQRAKQGYAVLKVMGPPPSRYVLVDHRLRPARVGEAVVVLYVSSPGTFSRRISDECRVLDVSDKEIRYDCVTYPDPGPAGGAVISAADLAFLGMDITPAAKFADPPSVKRAIPVSAFFAELR